MNPIDARSMILDVLAATELIDEGRRQDVLAGRAGDIEFAGLNIDSMKIIDLCMGLEERMGRAIRVEELIENPTLRRLADHLAKA